MLVSLEWNELFSSISSGTQDVPLLFTTPISIVSRETFLYLSKIGLIVFFLNLFRLFVVIVVFLILVYRTLWVSYHRFVLRALMRHQLKTNRDSFQLAE
jgi:hypothetical protein